MTYQRFRAPDLQCDIDEPCPTVIRRSLFRCPPGGRVIDSTTGGEAALMRYLQTLLSWNDPCLQL